MEAHTPLPAVPPSPTNAVADDPGAAWLGQLLFYDPRMSANGKVSCATCHDPSLGFADGQPLSQGIALTARHSPTLLNSAYQRWFFWDGRTDSAWSQSLQPLLDEKEMGATVDSVLDLLTRDPELRTAYGEVFGPVSEVGTAAGPTREQFLSHLGKAFEAYERLLVSKDSPFDEFVAKGTPLSQSAQRGLKLFFGRGRCFLCHAGPTFTDGEFHNIGLPPLPGQAVDLGRFTGVRKVKADRFNGQGEYSDDRSRQANAKTHYLAQKVSNLGEFKTPTLRSVAKTAPYMHDGRFATLREVLDYYSELPGRPAYGHREETLVPLRFTEKEKDDLVAFLRSLTGAPTESHLIGKPGAGSR